MKKFALPTLMLFILLSFTFLYLNAQTPTPMNWNDEDEDVTYERPLQLPKGDFDSHAQMLEADDLFQRRKYGKARDIYEIITYMSKGDTLVKRAQYQLANCYYKMRLYEDAIFEYQQLMRLFPYSQYNEDANYKIGTSWFKLSYPPAYDQQETINALQQFNHFIAQYPDSDQIENVKEMRSVCIDKLLEKKYLNAHIYYMMGYYNASIMYLNEIFDENIRGEVEEKALVLAGMIYIKKKNWDMLTLVGQQLSLEYPENNFIEKINKYITN
ncbi:MAG: outer membrane protein assembly factor BamD [Candidatus Cloacimonetes bacterium]|nr:outer membrane protein assembly factor BamD [Candidatus Cloacimonadota bacterium]